MGIVKNIKRTLRQYSFLNRHAPASSSVQDTATAAAVVYHYQPDHTVVADIAEFTGQSIEQVVQGIRDYRSLVQGEWANLGAISYEEAAKKFYSTSQGYIYDPLTASYSKQVIIDKLNGFSPVLLSSIRQHSGQRFLEFGGGLGVVCEIVAGFGKQVTYLDIPGRISEFATWRFRKYDLPIETKIVEPGQLDDLGDYDIIFTDAVLEHMPPAEQDRVVRILGHRLRPGGVLILLVDISGPTPQNPTHAFVDIHALHAALDEAGLQCQIGRGIFWSVWSRPD